MHTSALSPRPWLKALLVLAILSGLAIGACVCVGAAIVYTVVAGNLTRSAEPGPEWSATWAGDVDGDGTPDIVLAMRTERGSWNYSSAYVLSGKTRKCLRVFPDQQWPDFLYLAPARAGDVNGDGRDDLLVVHDLGRAIIDVADGRDLMPLENSIHELCCAAGDIDHDGCADLLVAGQPTSFGAHRFVSLVSGKSDRTLWSVDDGDPGLRSATRKFGYRGCAIGDVDNDGTNDFAVTTPRDRVRILSGRDGSTLRDLDIKVEGLECAGDVPGGRNVHLLIRRDVGRSFQVISALNGKTLLTIASPFNGPAAARPIGDYTGDGVPDIAISREDSLWIYSGADGREIAHMNDAGLSAAPADFDHDGRSDLLITRNAVGEAAKKLGDQAWRAGRVEVISGRDQSVLFALDGNDIVPIEK